MFTIMSISRSRCFFSSSVAFSFSVVKYSAIARITSDIAYAFTTVNAALDAILLRSSELTEELILPSRHIILYTSSTVWLMDCAYLPSVVALYVLNKSCACPNNHDVTLEDRLVKSDISESVSDNFVITRI